MLLDTNILIDILAGDEELENEIYAIGVKNCAISIVTYAEIMAGMRKSEKQETVELLNKLRVYHIGLTTSKKFMELVNFVKTKNREVLIADLLIASVSIDYNLKLYTFNRKDFDFIPNIDLHNTRRKLK